MHIGLRQMSSTEVLAGATHGRRMLASLLEAAQEEPSGPGPCFIDFHGITVATASFLRESVLAFRDNVRSRRSKIFPVIANVNGVVSEEFDVILRAKGDAMLICAFSEDKGGFAPVVVGTLDQKQRLTYDLVQTYGETDAGALMRLNEHEDVGVTAWNNRLSALASKSLVLELSQGRSKRYRKLVGG